MPYGQLERAERGGGRAITGTQCRPVTRYRCLDHAEDYQLKHERCLDDDRREGGEHGDARLQWTLRGWARKEKRGNEISFN